MPGLVWVIAKVEHVPLGVYPGILINAAPRLAIPVVAIYIAFRSFKDREVMFLRSINSQNRPVTFGLSLVCLGIIAAYPLTLTFLYVWRNVMEGFAP